MTDAPSQNQPSSPPSPPAKSPANGALWPLILLFVIVIGVSILGAVRGGGFSSGSGVNREEVEKIVADYIAKNPEAIISSVENMQRQKVEADMNNAKDSIMKNRDALEKDPASPVLGNPDGDVTVVEFFDYHCGFCKRVQPSVSKLIEEDKNVRLVMKEFPILSPVSEQAARAALAVHNLQPDKYLAFHTALMQGKITDKDSILAIATSLGLDSAKVEEEMEKNSISEAIQKNHELAGKIGVRGTPAFVIGETLVPGALNYDQLVEQVKSAREKVKH